MTRKLSVIITLFVFTLIAATSLFASNGTQIGTVGARSTAMGSCFRGLADDWSAVYYNPAGLTQLEGLTIGVSNGFIMPRGSYTPFTYPNDLTIPSLPFNGMYSWQERDLTAKTFLVPSLSIFYKFADRYTVGVGVYAPFGLGAEFDIFREPAGYRNGTFNSDSLRFYPAVKAISKDKETYSDHQVINIQPTFAMQVTEKLSVGLGVSYISGSMAIDQLKLPLNPLVSVWADPNYAALTGGLGALNEDQSHLIVENNLDGDGSAYGVNFGIHYQFSDKLSAGISARYCTDLKLEGTMEQTQALPGDSLKFQALSAMLQNPAYAPYAALLQQAQALFSGQNITEEYDVKADLPLPMTIGGGIAYKPSPKLTLTADVSFTNWASWDEIIVEKTATGEQDTMKEDWKNTIEMGLGVEYLAMEGESSNLYIRGGFYTVGSPSPDATMNPTILDPNTRYVITGGLGLGLGKVNLDLAVEYVLFPEKVIQDDEYVFNKTHYYAENYAGIYNLKSWVITLGASIGL